MNNEQIIEEKIVVLKIKGSEYKVKTTISMLLLQIILSEKNEDKAFTNRVAECIVQAIQLDNLEDKPSVKMVLEDGDYVFQEYINAVISNNDKYNSYFYKRPDKEPLCERFCKALDDYKDEILVTFSKQVAQIYQPLTEVASSISKAIAKAYEPALVISKQFADIVQRTNEITTNLSQSFAPMIKYIAEMQESILKGIEGVAKSWSEIDLAEFEGSYRIWGEYGWTLIWDAPFNLFKNQPKSQIDADKQALQFFDKKGIIKFLSDLKTLKVNKKDLESAIFCFNSRQYKACAMLLCAMIEAPLINKQKEGQYRRKVGRNAVIKLKHKTEGIETSMFLYLHTVNVLSFLEKLFDDANDFRVEPKHLNRNFIDHGMARRDVRRKDCIKLFLGLSNIMEMFELYDEFHIEEKD